MDLNTEMKNLAEYAKDKLQTELISDLNKQKDDLIISLKAANANLRVAETRTERYREKEYKAKEDAMKFSEELDKIKENVKAKNKEIADNKEELGELNELHTVMMKNFDESKK